mgnify:CR=1 FL=1
MGEEAGEVVVDTYALMAMVFGELSDTAEDILLGIHDGRIKGIIPSTVGYEFTLQWLRGRVPGLHSIGEVEAFLHAYFVVTNLTLEDFVEIARIKVEGDKLLVSSGDEELASRRLSLVDSSVILTATKFNAPIVTGDRDLTYVAEKLGLKVLW